MIVAHTCMMLDHNLHGYIHDRDALICKMTDILITDILAIKITDSNTDTNSSIMWFPTKMLQRKFYVAVMTHKIVNTYIMKLIGQ